MVKENTISKIGFFLIIVLLFSLFPKTVLASYDVDLPKNNINTKTGQVSDLINFQPTSYQDIIKRYIVFGPGSVGNIVSQANGIVYGMDSNHGSLALGFFNQDEISNLKLDGYNVMEDLPLEFDSITSDVPTAEVSRIGNILGSDNVVH